MSSRKKEDALLRSLHDPALSMEHPGAARVFWVSVLVIAAFIAWAAWAELDEVTRGDGRVIPFSRVQKIQSLEGGILKRLHVKEGEEVEAGQMLAEHGPAAVVTRCPCRSGRDELEVLVDRRPDRADRVGRGGRRCDPLVDAGTGWIGGAQDGRCVTCEIDQ